MSDDKFIFAMYLEPQQRPEEWYLRLLRHLWDRGLRFHPSPAGVSTWEGELDEPGITVSIAEYDAARGGRRLSDYTGPLRQGIQRLAKAGAGWMNVYDKEVGMRLYLEPNPSAAPASRAPTGVQARLGGAALFVEGTYLHRLEVISPSDETPHATLILPYQQVHIAALHWSGVLGDLVQPIWGFAYNPLTDVKDPEAFATRDDVLVADLRQGHVPDLTRWLYHDAPQYVGAPLVTPAWLGRMVDTAGYHVQRLAGGGVFVTPPNPAFAYEANAAYLDTAIAREKQDAVTQALNEWKKAGEPRIPGSQASAWAEAIREATARSRRALTIFETLGEREEVRVTQLRLQALSGLARQVQGAAGDTP